MIDMGLDFKAPRKKDVEAWKVLEILAQNGFTFDGCGCYVGSSKPPRTLREVPEWIEKHRHKSKGEKLLKKIAKRVKPRAKNRKPKVEPKFKSIG